MRIVIVRHGHNVAAAKHRHQHAGAIQRFHARLRAHALLKAAGGFRADAQRAGGHAVVAALERRALKEHRRGVVHDFALLAAHDAGQTRRALVVGNDQHFRCERVRLAVQRRQRLALMRAAHDDRLLAHLAQVERVHRMAGFQHHEVGNVHDVVDRTHACAVQIFAHPLGRRADFHVRDDSGAVARAVGLVLHAHLRVIGEHALAVFREGNLGHDEMLAQHGRAFARNAPHAQAVGTVRENLVFNHVVAKAEHLRDGHAQRVFLLQQDNALVAAMRIQRVRHVQLGAGAQHAAGLHAANLAALDLHAARQLRALQRAAHQRARAHVRRAADDLQRLVPADVHGADVQMVAVRMHFAG